MTNSLHQGEYQGQHWLWIELLGFELEDPDYGVSRYLERTGFIPYGVSLLLYDPEFVHGHREGDDERSFPPSICSYGGHPYNEERSVQPWTARDLKGLVKELKARGIKVFFTHFADYCGPWLSEHPEVRHVTLHGDRIRDICPYKRLADGRLYADFYLPLLAQTLRDYGFDGFHAGDGISHPRIPIYGGDFSDDSVNEYLKWGGGPFPASIEQQADGNNAAIQQRAEWIWREQRISWIGFQRQRALDFWSRAAEMLHADGKLLFLNTAWTRDPIEALYRYGVDYSALAEGGVDGFFAETAAAVHEYAGDLPYLEDGFDGWDPSRTLTRFATKLMLLRAAAPTAEIVFMNGIKDTNEAWSGIRHAQTNVESEMLIYTGLFQVGAKGALIPSSSGLIVTLADGMARHDWDWMRSRWDLGGSLQPTGLLGAAVYWSDAYPAGMVEEYAQTRLPLFQSLLWRLIVSGAPVLATVRPEHLADWNGPLLVIHPSLVPEDEWQQIMSRKEGPVITLGRKRQASADASCPAPAYRLADSTDKESLELAIYNGQGCPPPPAPVLPAPEPFDAASAEDPYQWLYDLPSRAVAPEFIRHAAEWIINLSKGIRVLKNENDIRAWGYVIGENRLRVHVRNDGFYYRAAVVEVGRPVTEVKTLTAFPGSPVDPSGGVLRFKIAGKSMAIFEIQIAD